MILLCNAVLIAIKDPVVLRLLYAERTLAEGPARSCSPYCVGMEAAREVQTSATSEPLSLSVCIALRSPGDRTGAYAQHMSGGLCRGKTAVCILWC